MSVYLGDLELATGGGATGTGLPVNSYKSFLVNSTGNPTGYDATTGLYTHPNGDYWLKTGSTLAAASATYPDASNTQAPARTITGVGTLGQGLVWSSDDKVIFRRTNTTAPTYEEWDFSTNAATGITFTLPFVGNDPGIIIGLVVDRANGFLWTAEINNNNSSATNFFRFTCFNLTTGAQLFTAQETSLSTRTDRRMNMWHNNGSDVSDIALAYSDASNVWQYRKLDFSGGSGVLPTITTLAGPVAGLNISNDGFYRISNSYGGTQNVYYDLSGNLRSWPSGVLTGGTSISPVTRASSNHNFNNDAWASFDSGAGSLLEYTTGGNTVGDATARTDTDTSQPLFIKIK